MKYILLPYNKALEAGIIKEDTTRRVDNLKTKVILYPEDFNNYTPNVITNIDGEDITITLYSLMDKVVYLQGIILSHELILNEIQNSEWN